LKKVWFYDLETLDEAFTATFVDRDSDETIVFISTDIICQIKELLDFLSTKVSGLIGYNCLHFDSQVLEHIIDYPESNHYDIRTYATYIIETENRRPDYPEYKLRIQHLDLFKALSLSTSAKRTSLKWCEFSMRMENIEDMPDNGTIEEILAYNLHDVIATKLLYNTYVHEIELRRELTKRENVNLMNSTEPDMAKKLFSKYLSKAMNISENDLRNMRTEREMVNISDIIFPYVDLKGTAFEPVHNAFMNTDLVTINTLDIEERFISKNSLTNQLELF
jgi:hypothetical protein